MAMLGLGSEPQRLWVENENRPLFLRMRIVPLHAIKGVTHLRPDSHSHEHPVGDGGADVIVVSTRLPPALWLARMLLKPAATAKLAVTSAPMASALKSLLFDTTRQKENWDLFSAIFYDYR